MINVGGTKIPLCSRCVALYPAAIMTAGIMFPLRWHPGVSFVGLLLVPGLLDWSLARLGYVAGKNWVRSTTGALAGVGMGLLAPAYLKNPAASDLWQVAGLVVAVWILVETARWAAGLDEEAGGRDEP